MQRARGLASYTALPTNSCRSSSTGPLPEHQVSRVDDAAHPLCWWPPRVSLYHYVVPSSLSQLDLLTLPTRVSATPTRGGHGEEEGKVGADEPEAEVQDQEEGEILREGTGGYASSIMGFGWLGEQVSIPLLVLMCCVVPDRCYTYPCYQLLACAPVGIPYPPGITAEGYVQQYE